MSHPIRVRGLKFIGENGVDIVAEGRTPYGCVDWNILPPLFLHLDCSVAPHTGAWIEISLWSSAKAANCVAPHTGAWIEIYYESEVEPTVMRRTPYGCVDWNILPPLFLHLDCSVAPHTGAWIEICFSVSFCNKFHVAPHTGAWIEIYYI